MSLLRIYIPLLLTTCVGCTYNGPSRQLPPRTEVTSLERAFLATDFVPLTSVGALHPEMRALVAPMPFPFAEPGQTYNSTDYVAEDEPRVRLIVGGKTGDIGFILYDAGGFVGEHQRLLIARFSDNHVSAFGSFYILGNVRSIEAVKTAVPALLENAGHTYGCR